MSIGVPSAEYQTAPANRVLGYIVEGQRVGEFGTARVTPGDTIGVRVLLATPLDSTMTLGWSVSPTVRVGEPDLPADTIRLALRETGVNPIQMYLERELDEGRRDFI